MHKLTKKISEKIEKDLCNKIGKENTDFLLDKFGRGKSFLNTICLLPQWFNDSFLNLKKENYNTKLLAEANLKAWIGYTIYDYFRDGKIPKEKIIPLISVANIYIQYALIIFIEQCGLELKKKRISNLFNTIDLFYIKQDKTKEFNDFNLFCSILHEKSIAAAISAILVIPSNSYISSEKNVINFFKFYFTARQLSDDLDDYKKDLKFKINTPVTLMIKNGLSGNDLKSFIREEIDLNFNKAIKSLHKIKDFDSELFIKRYVKPC